MLAAAYDHDVLAEHVVAGLPGVGRKVWRLCETDDGFEWRPYWVPDDGQPEELPWSALPGSQNAFLSCPAFECLAYGPRGSAKSAALVMDFAQEVGRGYGRDWTGLLVTRLYKGAEQNTESLESLISDFFPGARFFRSQGNHYAEWPTGEKLYIRALDNVTAFRNTIKGKSISWLGFDELSHWSEPDVYLNSLTVLRTTNQRIPKRVRSATNPGPHDHWAAKRFKIPELDGQIWGEPGRQRCAIRSYVSENLPLVLASPDYVEQLVEAALSPGDLASNVLGIWHAGSSALFELWTPDVHVVPAVNVDALGPGWRIFRAFDHGSSSPFSYQVWAESDGSPVSFMNGMQRRTIRGDHFLLHEWYGCQNGNPNRGLRLSIPEVARGIVARERHWNLSGRVEVGPADSSIFAPDSDRAAESLADLFSEHGVDFEPSTKGSRAAGYDQLRALMLGSFKHKDGLREHPGLFITKACPWAIRLIGNAPRDPDNLDDVPGGFPDHCLDAARYAIASGGRRIHRKGF